MYDANVNTNFQGEKVTKENDCILLFQVFCCWNWEKVLTQTLLEECKYEIKKTKIENLISD